MKMRNNLNDKSFHVRCLLVIIMISFSFKSLSTITNQELSIKINIFLQKMFTRLTLCLTFASLVFSFSTNKKIPDAVNYYPKTIGYITWR